MKRPLTVFIFSVVLMGVVQAQYTSLNEETKSMIDEGKKTTAVLDFEARGINEREAKTLTDRFSSALGKTNKVILVQRTMMKEILEEQGFQQSGCTSDECAVEVGALLGCQYMISGAIGQIGNSYTIDVKNVSVESGATENSQSSTYAGPKDGLIVEIEILAWLLMNLEPPKDLLDKQKRGAAAYAPGEKPKTKVGALMRSLVVPGFGQIYSGKKGSGFAILLLEAGLIGMAAKSNSDYASFQTEYNTQLANYDDSTGDELAGYKVLVKKARSDMVASNDQLNLFIYASAGLWAINTIHAFLVGPKPDDDDDEEASKTPPFQLAYSPLTNQVKLQWEIDL
jgi:TM2 domain-containing membrane protein YozV